VVEDDPEVLEQLAGMLEDEGYEVERASTAEAGLVAVGRSDIGLVVTDLRLPRASGLDVVEAVVKSSPNVPVLVITAHATIDTAVKAMRLGAFHYLEKPLSVDTVLMEVEKAVEHGNVLREREALRQRLSSDNGLGRILGESRVIRELCDTIRRVAKTDSTVLITGETGTGKELVVNALHYESERASRPVISVNCAALSESLLESELFGHEKGAFTGAERRRQGRFERADGGTLFLDEITEMGAHVQAKLLRVLQGDSFERVGGEEAVEVDVRLVAATNRDPERAVDEGLLRKDLFYRLNIVRIDVPPLGERLEDVPILAESFLARYAAKYAKDVKGISADVMNALAGHAWPGNVRELENCMERAVVLAQGEQLGVGDLPAPVSEAGPGTGAPPSAGTLNLQEVEKRVIRRALDECGWNKARASEKLGIFPSSLYKKMKRFGIPQKRPS
jgi:DNA-binding NtrC family response regulator